MALIQKKKIKDIVVTNTADNIVTQVIVEWHIYDSIDIEEYSTKETKTFTLETDDVDSSSDSFIKFADLTENIVMDWLEEKFQSPRILEMEERMKSDITRRVNPPAPVEPELINKGLPWS
jgi:hypothetical protein